MKKTYVTLAILGIALLGGCIVVPAGYYHDRPHYYHDRDRYYRGG